VTYERVAKLARVRELWLWCIGSGLLACDSELLADYLVIDGIAELRTILLFELLSASRVLRAAVLHKMQAEVILHGMNKRLLSWQVSDRVMSDRTAG
jgi:hypothetical protein